MEFTCYDPYNENEYIKGNFETILKHLGIDKIKNARKTPFGKKPLKSIVHDTKRKHFVYFDYIQSPSNMPLLDVYGWQISKIYFLSSIEADKFINTVNNQ